MKTRNKLAWFCAVALASLCTVGLAWAESAHEAVAVSAAVPAEHAAPVADSVAPAAPQAEAAPAAAHGVTPAEPAHEAGSDHAVAAHEGSGHSSHHGSEEPPTLDQINWFYGFLGESDQAEPSLLYRPKGMSSPFLATLINWAVLVSLIAMLAKKQIPPALAKRKAAIVQGMNDAKKARDESAALLSEYESKLATIDQDIERIKAEMKRAGEQERERILAEAVERRTRMERDARRLIETEIESAKEALRREVVQAALATAKRSIEDKLAASDQQRLFDEAIASLKKLPTRSLGGEQA